ncbi:alpha-1,2-fucosyltransferase [Helicobacter fennelliae]|uniref:alpha-1,2-fucosyltransferase n=1 Tax=Helicobacter fennelliae TaxID=215 RepID=UPI0009DF63CF|nr:alpha-1,2-fucosyltransferase [Helicobacter fennelliae]
MLIRGGAVVFIDGGLGNQFFHYAFCVILYRYLKKPVYLDCTQYRFTTSLNARNLELVYFSPILPIITSKKELIQKLNISYCMFCLKKLGNKILYKLCKKQPFFLYDKQKTLTKPHLRFESIAQLAQNLGNHNYIYEEYMWNFKEIKSYKDEFLQILYPQLPLDSKSLVIAQQIQSHTNSCSIHIRRGDYLMHIPSDVLDMEYYLHAMEQIRQLVSNVKFFIFGNDFAYMRGQFSESRDCVIVDVNGEYEVRYDFLLMKMCKHHILANSTLSMWVGFGSYGYTIYKANAKPSTAGLETLGFIAL